VVEHDYAECTGSAIQALVLFKKLYPRHRETEIKNSIANAVHGMEVGEFATFMALGLHFVVLQQRVKLTLIVLPFAKPLNFYFQH